MRKVALCLALVTTSIALVACIDRDRTDVSQRSSALTATAALAAPPAPSKDRFFTFVKGKTILPKWKTNWERNLERLSAKAKAAGKINADSYDDYRNLNYDKFFITKAPTTTSFRVAAEYEPVQAYLLSWTTGLGAAIDKVYQDYVKGVWGVVPVIMVYANATQKSAIETALTGAGIPAADLTNTSKIIWWKHDIDSIWARDFGPIGLVSTGAGTTKVAFADFRYYHARTHDDEIPTDLAALWGVNVYRPDLDFEGGNFMNTTDGLCAATKGVLWFNLQFAQSAIEDIFKQYLSCKKTIFPAPLDGEETTHIDMFSKIGTDTKVLVGEYTTTQDATNKAILDANATLFSSTTNGSGGTITVTRIPMPNKGSSGGYTVWRTYTNSQALATATTKVIAIPVYSDETSTEATALTAYSTVFAGWTQVKVDSKSIIPWGGSLHCISMQIPVGDHTKIETDPADLCGAKKIACVVATCGNITDFGCCQGAVLKYCDSGKLQMMDCTTQPSCGWSSSSGYYDCGTAGGSDTSGKYVKNCDVLTDAAVPDGVKLDGGSTGCGKVTEEGCCDGQTVWYCDGGVLTNINCSSNPSCGWDSSYSYYDCGTSGGADPSGTNPKSCAGVVGDGGMPKSDGIKLPDGGGTGCGTVSEEGCCDGQTLKYCDGGVLETMDCTSSPSCGWDSSYSYYDCGTSGTADPSGKNPMACSGTKTDSGTPKSDKGTTADKSTIDQSGKADQSAVFFDGSSTSDKSVVKQDGGGKTGGDGCSCNIGTEGSSSALSLLLLGLGVVIVVRSRSRARSR
jgi:agmatine deiminase